MKKVVSLFLLLLAAGSISAQQYAIEANLKSALRNEDGVRVEVFENSKRIASVNSDLDGKAFIRFNGYFPGNTRSLVVHKEGFKRYVIDIESIKKDVKFELELKEYSIDEENLMDRVVNNLDKVDGKFATLFFLLETSGELKSVTYTEISQGRSMNKIIPALVVPDAAAAAAKKAQEAAASRAAYEQEQATMAAKESANKASYEADQAQGAREKWQKKLDGYQKKQSKIGDDREQLRRRQRKLDKKRKKISPDKAESMQESITRDRRSLDKRQQKLDKSIKKHMKQEPK